MSFDPGSDPASSMPFLDLSNFLLPASDAAPAPDKGLRRLVDETYRDIMTTIFEEDDYSTAQSSVQAGPATTAQVPPQARTTVLHPTLVQQQTVPQQSAGPRFDPALALPTPHPASMSSNTQRLVPLDVTPMARQGAPTTVSRRAMVPGPSTQAGTGTRANRHVVPMQSLHMRSHRAPMAGAAPSSSLGLPAAPSFSAELASSSMQSSYQQIFAASQPHGATSALQVHGSLTMARPILQSQIPGSSTMARPTFAPPAPPQAALATAASSAQYTGAGTQAPAMAMAGQRPGPPTTRFRKIAPNPAPPSAARHVELPPRRKRGQAGRDKKMSVALQSLQAGGSNPTSTMQNAGRQAEAVSATQVVMQPSAQMALAATPGTDAPNRPKRARPDGSNDAPATKRIATEHGWQSRSNVDLRESTDSVGRHVQSDNTILSSPRSHAQHTTPPTQEAGVPDWTLLVGASYDLFSDIGEAAQAFAAPQPTHAQEQLYPPQGNGIRPSTDFGNAIDWEQVRSLLAAATGEDTCGAANPPPTMQTNAAPAPGPASVPGAAVPGDAASATPARPANASSSRVSTSARVAQIPAAMTGASQASGTRRE